MKINRAAKIRFELYEYQPIKVMERHLTNLTDKRRQVTKKSLIRKKGKRKDSLRNLMNAILYLLSKELLGKKTIISEACNLRDNYQALQARGYNVVGVSKDSSASHRKFADKYELPFTLLADPSTEMIQAFGAWGEKKLYGKPYMGTLRLTFIFDENGILNEIIEKVDTKNHAEQILK